MTETTLRPVGHIVATNDLAYYLSGTAEDPLLVPCRVIVIHTPDVPAEQVTVRATADRFPWEAGDVLHRVPADRIIARRATGIRKGRRVVVGATVVIPWNRDNRETMPTGPDPAALYRRDTTSRPVPASELTPKGSALWTSRYDPVADEFYVETPNGHGFYYERVHGDTCQGCPTESGPHYPAGRHGHAPDCTECPTHCQCDVRRRAMFAGPDA